VSHAGAPLNTQENQMDLSILSKLLWRKKWYLIGIPLVAFATSLLLTKDMKPEFKSASRLATGFTVNERIALTNDGFNIRDAEVKFNNLIQNMSSDIMLSMLSYRLMLNDLGSRPFRKPNQEIEVYLSDGELKEAAKVLQNKLETFTMLSSYEFKERKLLRLIESYGYLPETIDKHLTIEWIHGSDFVEAQYVSESPFLSAFVVNAVGEEAIRYEKFLKSRRGDQSVNFFAGLVTDRKKALDEKTALLHDLRSSSSSISLEDKSANAASIRDFEAKRAEAMSNIQRIRLSLDNLRRKTGENSSATQQNQINANVSKIRKRIEDLTAQYEAGGSKDAALQQQIQDLWSQLQTELSRVSETPGRTREDLMLEQETLEIELKVAENDLESANNMLATLKSSVSGAASKETTLENLQRQVDKASDEYFEALNRYNTERSKTQIESPLQLVIKGQAAGEPEFPKQYLIVGFSVITSFVLCLAVILISEYVDSKIKNREQFRRAVGLDLAGTVNRIRTKNLNLNDLFSSKKNRDLEQFKNSLRKLRHDIKESKGRVFLVTSPKANEGKTFISLCISFMLARLKHRVLIIDTNFHHNSLTQILLKNFNNQKKLEQWTVPAAAQITTGAPASEDPTEDYKNAFINSIVRSETHHWIDVIGNNGTDSTPSEIFAEKNFESIIASLKEYYDYIIMEGAPLNTHSDSMELVNYADKVIPVFSAESEIDPEDRESIEYLKSLDGKLMGAILNKTNVKDLNAY
jgi:succinoglycan biosynthesis transport protein ExoP